MPLTSQPSAGELLRPLGRGRHGLSDLARQGLAGVLDCLDLDPTRPQMVFGFTGQSAAFVIGRRVTLHAARWQSLDGTAQLGLLAHELTHVAQYDRLGRLGVPRFLVRYMPDYYLDPDNYRMPEELAAQAITEVNPLDPRYTLDQLAERFRSEVQAPAPR